MRVQVDHGGEWWLGTAGVTRWSEGDNAYVTRIAYDAQRGWKPTSEWHEAGAFEWRAEA